MKHLIRLLAVLGAALTLGTVIAPAAHAASNVTPTIDCTGNVSWNATHAGWGQSLTVFVDKASFNHARPDGWWEKNGAAPWTASGSTPSDGDVLVNWTDHEAKGKLHDPIHLIAPACPTVPPTIPPTTPATTAPPAPETTAATTTTPTPVETTTAPAPETTLEPIPPTVTEPRLPQVTDPKPAPTPDGPCHPYNGDPNSCDLTSTSVGPIATTTTAPFVPCPEGTDPRLPDCPPIVTVGTPPTVPAAVTTVAASTTAARTGTLPETGGGPGPLVILGVGFLFVGGVVFSSRRLGVTR